MYSPAGSGASLHLLNSRVPYAVDLVLPVAGLSCALPCPPRVSFGACTPGKKSLLVSSRHTGRVKAKKGLIRDETQRVYTMAKGVWGRRKKREEGDIVTAAWYSVKSASFHAEIRQARCSKEAPRPRFARRHSSTMITTQTLSTRIRPAPRARTRGGARAPSLAPWSSHEQAFTQRVTISRG